MTVPKRRIAREQSSLMAVGQIANQLEHQWPSFVAVMAAMAAPTLKAAAGGDGGRSSDHPDRTWAIVASMEPYDDVCEAVSAWLTQGRWLQAELNKALRNHPDVAREGESLVRALRCDGSVDPTCTRNAVRGGKCWTCIKRVQRAESAVDNVHTPDLRVLDNVHTEVVETGSVANCAPSVDAVCGACGWTFPAPSSEAAMRRLAMHRAAEHGAA